jgi:hypothetical protein
MVTDPHRSALDHVLRLVAESSWAETLMVRGSMAMPAWVGDRARPPADLDLVVLHTPAFQPDPLSPWPLVERIDPAQHWPEAVHGGARNEMWTFEEFDTGGQRPQLPPEGLRWMAATELSDFEPNHDFILELIQADPWTPEGVVFHPTEADGTDDWDYDDGDYASSGTVQGRRARVLIPWVSPDFETGRVQIDISYDEHVPVAPELTALPRADGRDPVAVLTPGRELSLAWKLHWLAADQADQRVSAAKDLYDAVLLAELPGIRLSAGLHALAVTGGPVPLTPAAMLGWSVDGHLEGGPQPWLERLAAALPALAPLAAALPH